MTTAICDPEAFYPFRSLVEGPLYNPAEFPKLERFVRSIILHDEMRMILSPLEGPGDDDENEWSPEEIAAGGRAVIVGIGPVIEDTASAVCWSISNRRMSRRRLILHQNRCAWLEGAGASRGPYLYAHIKYIQNHSKTVSSGGSIASESAIPEGVVDLASKIPDHIFAQLDAGWANLINNLNEGRIGLVVPPFLSILLNRCARRDAIPQVLADMRNEFSDARQKVWALLDARRSARTIAEAAAITAALDRAGRLMMPNEPLPAVSPVRALWQIGTAAIGGAGAGALVGGHPLIRLRQAQSIRPSARFGAPNLIFKWSLEEARLT